MVELIVSSLILLFFRMNHATNYDYFSCFLDLLNYQKTEITDCISILLSTKLPLLEEGLLLCTFPLPSTNHEFKMYIRKITHDPLVLEQFTLEENGTDAIIQCNIKYDTFILKSKPLFTFPCKDFKNFSNLQKQLNALTFSYTVLKSHVFFQVMLLNGAGTKFEFHYNSTHDCYATSPNGHTYSMFLSQYGNKITSVKALSAVNNTATVPIPPGQPQSPYQQPPPSPSHPSIPVGTAPPVSFTPHRTHAGPHSLTDRRDSARRHIFEEQNIRSRHSSDTVREDTRTTRLSRTNLKIVKEIAAYEQFTANTDMIQEMFQTPGKWNINRYGILDLALRGVIPITDKRVHLEDIGGDVDKSNEISEVNTDKDTTAE